MLTFNVLSSLLRYPEPELREHLTAARQILREERLVGHDALAGLEDLIDYLEAMPQMDVEAAYLEAFERGRSTSLYLFEHIHGESRDRGQAMVRLMEQYERHGLQLEARELPDFLPLFLEFLATRPLDEARQHIAEVGDIIDLIAARLRRRGTPFAAAAAAVAEFSAQPSDAATFDDVVQQEDRDDTPAALDAAWLEAPVTFNDAEGPDNAGSGCGRAASAVATVTEGGQ